MTDPISQLADSIVALINSKPQSPTKAEVESAVILAMLGAGRHDRVGPFTFQSHHEGFRPLSDELLDAIDEEEASRAFWDAQERAAHKAMGYEGPTTLERLTARLAALPDLNPGATSIAIREEAIRSNDALLRDVEVLARRIERRSLDLYDGFSPAEKASQPCPGYGYRHHWEVDPWSTRAVRNDEVANRCVCGAIKP